MSCLNLWIDDGRALLAVDTNAMALSTPIAGQTYPASKFMVLPHAHVALATSGWAAVLPASVYAVSVEAEIQDFDSAEAHMCRVLDQAHAGLIAHCQQVSDASEMERVAAAADRQEVVLVGWSRREQSMQASRFSKASRSEAFVCSRIEGNWLMSPWDDAMGPPPQEDLDTDDAMERMINRQVRFAAVHRPHLLGSFGGHMVTAEITREAITLRRRALVGVE